MTDALQNEDLSAPRGFLIYITFDEDMNVISDHSDILPVSSPNQLEFLQSEQLVMPENGYFYTYLTNTSDQLVSFDNLTVHHKQGRVRALYDYYPYGLMWSNVRDDQYDNTFEGSEFAHGEWGISGLNMNYFEARWYDPALGRWHSPDPLEQFHSPYVGMANDPANFVDPDGRSAVDWLDAVETIGVAVAGTYLTMGAPGLSTLISGCSATVISVVGTAANVAAVAGTIQEISQFQESCSAGASSISVSGNNSNKSSSNINLHDGVGLSFTGAEEENNLVELYQIDAYSSLSEDVSPPDKYQRKLKRFQQREKNMENGDASINHFRDKYKNRRWMKIHNRNMSETPKHHDASQRMNFNKGGGNLTRNNTSVSVPVPSARSSATVPSSPAPTPIRGGGAVYIWGYNVCTVNPGGTLSVVNIGSYNTSLQLSWLPGTPGVTANSPIMTDASGNILNDAGATIYSLPKGALQTDLFIPAAELASWAIDSGGRRGVWSAVSPGDQVFRMNPSTGVYQNVTLTIGR